MDTKKLFAELEQNFGLRKNHILILEALTKDDYTADRLVTDTKIPLGRIYEYLNDLLEMKLIEKKPGYPSSYAVEKLEDRILDFIKYQSISSLTKEKRLLNLLETEEESEILLITARDQLAFETMKLVQESNETKSLGMPETLPTIIYPLDEEKFVQYREFFGKKRKKPLFGTKVDRTRILMFRNTKEAYQKGKKFVYITDKKTLDSHLDFLKEKDKKFFREFVSIMEDQFNKYQNIKAYVSDETLPMSIGIYDKTKVLIRMRHFDIPVGVLIKSKKTAEFYDDFFEELISKAEPIKKYLKKYIDAKNS